MLLILLISCVTTNKTGYKFPGLGEERREIDGGGNVTAFNKNEEVVFYYDSKADTVTIPFWYWIKIMNYGINTGGL